MTAVERYNALDGQTVSREELQEIAYLGDIQGQVMISQKIKEVLSAHEDPTFFINISETAIDRVPEDILPGLHYADCEEEFTGLEKAVAPDDIYQMITDKMLAQLKEATGQGYKKKWKKQNEEGYLLPFNFDTKKMYRGINIALLTEGMSKVLKNPFFLTFNQIEKHKGKLKKGSKGLPVVYFTMLYSVSETNEAGEKIEFGTYNKKKFLAWIDKNIHRLKFSLDYYRKTYIPILKYYNVFNGADIEGIDFDLENFKIGFQDGSEVVKNNDPRVEIADLIVKHYPNPQPKLKDSTDGRAFYRHGLAVDEIHMPKFENFETGLDYYRTLFHEFTHSTGIATRLDRPMGGKFGSKQYAKEELVAEFGAVFLSAHAGIIWYNQKNHAEYLKNWNTVLTHAEEDNRFFMRAASKAQEAADFILNLDAEGVPAYQNSLKSESSPDPKGRKEFEFSFKKLTSEQRLFDVTVPGWNPEELTNYQLAIAYANNSLANYILRNSKRFAEYKATNVLSEAGKKELGERIKAEIEKRGISVKIDIDLSEGPEKGRKNLAKEAKEVREELQKISSDFQVKTDGGKQKESKQNLEIFLKNNKVFRTPHRELFEKLLGSEVVNSTSAIVYVGMTGKFLKGLQEYNKAETSEDYPFSPSDIPYQTAYDAHRGTSFSPEKRAKSEQNGYFSFLKETYDTLKEKAHKTGRMEEFENNFPRFQDGYKKRYLKHLQAKNGLMSTMITGPANFPVRRMEKKNQTIHKRLNELVDYGNKAEKYILPFKSTAIKTGQDDSLAKLEKKLADLQEAHDLMKEANKIFRKYNNKKYSKDERYKALLEELQKIGFSSGNAQKMALENKIPGFMLSNSNANIKRIKDRIAQEKRLQAAKEKGNAEIPFPGGKIEYNREINKIQIHFDEKPDADTRSFLKKAGQAFKWSPKNKVWQRQLNTYYRLNKNALFEFLKVEDPKGLSAPWHAEGSIERKALDNCGRLEKGYKYGKGGKILKSGEEDNITRTKPVKKTPVKKSKPAAKAKAKKIDAADHSAFEKKYGISPKEAVKFLNRGIAVDFTGDEVDFYRELLVINHNEGLKLNKNKISILDDFSFELNDSIKIKKAPVMRKTGEDSLESIVGRDPIRPVLSGVHVAEDAYVATDAHKLVKIVANPPKNKVGKTINLNPRYSGTDEPFIEGKYPNYEGVIPNYHKSEISGWFDLQEVLNDVHSLIQLGNPVNGLKKIYLAKKLAVNPDFFLAVLRVLKANGSTKVKFGAQQSNRAVMLYTDNGNTGLLMPIMIDGKMEGMNLHYHILEDLKIGLAGAAPGEMFGGLAAPVEDRPTAPQPQPVQKQPEPVITEPIQETNRAKSLAEAMQQQTAGEIFNVPGDIGRFLGQVEKKPVHSVVTTLDAEQGAGKTRFLFQVMNVLAGMGLKCLFISLEEHPASKLFRDKVKQYIDPANLERISALEEVENWNRVKYDIHQADVIFIDSFQKLPPNLDLDQDIRKAFNGKWFFVIYQQTGTKSMRGGSKAAFDGDQILKVQKDVEDYRNNYVYANKNRYNDAPDLKLNIFTGKLEGEAAQPEPEPIQDSREPDKPTGRLIATPTV